MIRKPVSIHPVQSIGVSSAGSSRGDSGWYARLCRWVAALAGRNAGAAEAGALGAVLVPMGCASARAIGAGAPPSEASSRAMSNILEFPDSARGLLTRLARDIDMHCSPVEGCVISSLGAGPRLWIDGTAYAEIGASNRLYRVILGADLPTRILLETTEFNEASRFIREYVVATRGCSGDGDRT